MKLDFWDGILIASAFWWIVSAICLFRGFWVGRMSDTSDWCAGYDAGWESAEKVYTSEPWRKAMEDLKYENT